jgi:hypothetical protein
MRHPGPKNSPISCTLSPTGLLSPRLPRKALLRRSNSRATDQSAECLRSFAGTFAKRVLLLARLLKPLPIEFVPPLFKRFEKMGLQSSSVLCGMATADLCASRFSARRPLQSSDYLGNAVKSLGNKSIVQKIDGNRLDPDLFKLSSLARKAVVTAGIKATWARTRSVNGCFAAV